MELDGIIEGDIACNFGVDGIEPSLARSHSGFARGFNSLVGALLIEKDSFDGEFPFSGGPGTVDATGTQGKFG